MKRFFCRTLLLAALAATAAESKDAVPEVEFTGSGQLTGDFQIRFNGLLACDLRVNGKTAPVGNLVTLSGIMPNAGGGTVYRSSGKNFQVLKTQAASSRFVRRHTRTLCWLSDPETQSAVLVTLDQQKKAPGSAEAPVWQINSMYKPENVGNDLMIRNHRDDRGGRLLVQLLKPTPAERTLAMYSDATLDSVAARRENMPEAPNQVGYRNLYTAAAEPSEYLLLAVLQAGALEADALPVKHRIAPQRVSLQIGGRLLEIGLGAVAPAEAFPLTVPASTPVGRVLLVDLAAGRWNAVDAAGAVAASCVLTGEAPVAELTLPAGQYTVAPAD